MKIIEICIVVLLVFVSTLASAITTPLLYLSIDPALVFTRIGITQQIKLYDDIGNTYVNTNRWQQEGSLIMGLGARIYQNESLQINTGFRYIPIIDLPLNGQIWQLNSPLFNNLSYQYQVKSNVLLFDNTILWTKHRLQPGVIWGLGGSNNTTSALQEFPLTDSAMPSLSTAAGKKTNQFAYELGAVLDYSMQEVVLELAYRFVNAGQGYLQPYPLQNTSDHLSTGLLHYNLISLGIRGYYAL